MEPGGIADEMKALAAANPDVMKLEHARDGAAANMIGIADRRLDHAFATFGQGLGEQNEASRWVVKALEINPENTAALYTLVQIANERGKFGEVRAALERYTDLHPHDHNMLYTLAAIKHKGGDHKAAKACVERIISVDPYNERAQLLDKQIARVLGPAAETGTSN